MPKSTIVLLSTYLIAIIPHILNIFQVSNLVIHIIQSSTMVAIALKWIRNKNGLERITMYPESIDYEDSETPF